MTGAELAAVLTAAASLVAAIAALVRAWRTSSQLQAHRQAVTPKAAQTTRSAEAGWVVDE